MSQPKSMDGQEPVTSIHEAAAESMALGNTPSAPWAGGTESADWGFIRWQTGPILEHGRNGILMEELLEFVVLPRLRAYNRPKVWTYELNGTRSGQYFATSDEARAAVAENVESGIEQAAIVEVANPFVSRENALCITHIEEGLLWQKRRTELRRRQGVEGRSIPHRSDA